MTTPYYNAGDSGGPIVVQGHVVQGQAANSNSNNLIPASAYEHNNDTPTGEWTKGEQQPRQCRDVFWAILFYIHIGAIAFCTAKFSPLMAEDLAEEYAGGAQRSLSRFLEDNGGDDEVLDIDMDALLIVLCSAGLAGLVISTLAMSFMINFAEGLIKTALFFNIFVTAGMTIFALVAGETHVAILSGLGFLFSAYYCYVVWNRIPFAASNLVTATTAVRSNSGLAFFAYTNFFVSFLWSICWAVAFVATFYVLGECDGDGNCEQEINGFVVFLFLVSYFWTAQVVKNVVHVTTAGTVGTWWFTPIEATSCCSRGVRDSYVRSITTSFGSICFGSLIVAIIQAVKEVLHSMRERNGSIVMCFADCLLGCFESLVEYFNQWAFVYVGLYGYTFMEAGMNVMKLFRSRGWTAIIADMLVDTVLLMVSLGVGLLTGVVGLVVGSMLNQDATTLGVAFVAGMLIGFVLCSTLLSLVSSAVNATIVLYAEAPAEFQANHPQLSDHMRAAWKQAYPANFNY